MTARQRAFTSRSDSPAERAGLAGLAMGVLPPGCSSIDGLIVRPAARARLSTRWFDASPHAAAFARPRSTLAGRGSVEFHRQGGIGAVREHARDLPGQHPAQREFGGNFMLREPGHRGGFVTGACRATGDLADEEHLQAGPEARRITLPLAGPGCGKL